MAPGEAVAGLTPLAYAQAVVDGGAGGARRFCAYLLTTLVGGLGSVVLLIGARLHPDRAGGFEAAALLWFLAFGVSRSALLGPPRGLRSGRMIAAILRGRPLAAEAVDPDPGAGD